MRSLTVVLALGLVSLVLLLWLMVGCTNPPGCAPNDYTCSPKITDES